MVSRFLNLKGINLNEDFYRKGVDFEVVSNKDIAIIGVLGKFATETVNIFVYSNFLLRNNV